MAKDNKKFHFQANGGVVIAWSSSLSVDIIATASGNDIFVNHLVLLQWYQQSERYLRPLPPHFPAICLKIQFLAIFDHFSQIVPTHQQSLDPTSAFIGINIMKGCCCNDIYGEKATPHYYHTIFLPENSIFDHFSPFVITQSQPLDPTSTFIGKNIIKGCCCNDIYREKATPGYYHTLFPPFAWKFNFWSFLAIFGHFSPLVPTYARPLT